MSIPATAAARAGEILPRSARFCVRSNRTTPSCHSPSARWSWWRRWISADSGLSPSSTSNSRRYRRRFTATRARWKARSSAADLGQRWASRWRDRASAAMIPLRAAGRSKRPRPARRSFRACRAIARCGREGPNEPTRTAASRAVRRRSRNSSAFIPGGRGRRVAASERLTAASRAGPRVRRSFRSAWRATRRERAAGRSRVRSSAASTRRIATRRRCTASGEGWFRHARCSVRSARLPR